jgi:formate dehydrogenase major subunit
VEVDGKLTRACGTAISGAMTVLTKSAAEGNMTYKANGIKSETPDVWIEVSHQLAVARKIEDGRLVELTSRYGKVRLRALVTDRVQGHQLYMPMNSSERAI